MASDKETRWIYSKEDLEATPSRKDKIDADKELSYRQQAANLIQDMGQRLSVNQLTINTAIVYMHRFYVFHSFTVFSRYAIAPTALFVAAKVEEQPKKLEHVLKICHVCLHPDKPNLDTHSDAYLKQAQELVQNELILLQTLGFEISVDHPHTHVVKCTQLVKASRDLSQMAYFMATNSLHLTTFCLLYKPTVVAAMCIHLSCKWSNYEIPLSSDGKPYWAYMDSCITESLLDTIINEFLKILNRCPTRLRKLKNYRPSCKDGNETKDENNQSAPQIQPSKPSAQGQPQAEKQPTQPPPPTKEKKPSMSYEEYMNKRTHVTKPPHPPQHHTNHHSTQHHSSTHGQVKKVDNHAPTSQTSHPSSRPPHALPHHNTVRPHQIKDHPDPPFSKSSHPQRKLPADPHQSRRPPHHEHLQKNMMKPSDQHHAREKRTIKQERTRPSDRHPNPKLHQQPASGNQIVTKRSNTSESAEEVALNKTLEGRIHSEKLLQQRGTSSIHTKPSSHQQTFVSAPQAGNSDPARRHHSDKARVEADSQAAHGKEKRLDSKQIAEMYKKNPDKLRHYLKRYAQSAEEKHLLVKLQAREEEKRRRKAAEAQAMKNSKPPAHQAIEKSSASRVESPSGGLTLRIKLPKPGSGESGSSASVAKIVASSSGSDSQHSPVQSRKRGHGDPAGRPGHLPAKHSRRSEDQNKHNQSSGSKHRQHSKPRTRPDKPSEPIDEAVFQKSLSDALSQVQASSSVSATLKRTSNGKETLPFKTSSSRYHGFDPSATISAQLPDDIFEDDADQDAPCDKNVNSLSVGNPSQLSTPESGEIKDESPPYPKSSKFPSAAQKAPSLFSPPNSLDSQLMRSSSGYHSGQDTDFSPPVLLQKPYV